jgi:hypothetical protein
MEQNMSDENRGSAAWKNRLEDPAIVASGTIALWEKLHARLKAKPRRKRVAAWYWLAAACLLAGMLLPFINYNFTEKTTNKTTPVKQTRAAGIAPQITSVPLGSPVENTNVVVEKKQSFVAVKQVKPTTPVLQNALKEPVIETTAPMAKNDIQPLQDRITPVNNAPVLIATTGPVLKQKLKVVHINELGYPEEITHREEHVADYRTIRFNPVSPETYTTTSTTQNVSDLNFFKTKTSPSN